MTAHSSEKRDRHIEIRASRGEIEQARALWQQSRPQVGFSTWCRDRILKRVQPRPLFSSVDDEKAFLRELRRIGVNVNQIARAANLNDTADAEAMRKEMRGLWQLVSQAMR